MKEKPTEEVLLTTTFASGYLGIYKGAVVEADRIFNWSVGKTKERVEEFYRGKKQFVSWRKIEPKYDEDGDDFVTHLKQETPNRDTILNHFPEQEPTEVDLRAIAKSIFSWLIDSRRVFLIEVSKDGVPGFVYQTSDELAALYVESTGGSYYE